jgi:hypothetical protein
MELLDFVVYTAVGELLARIRYIKEEVKSLDMIYGEVHPIYYRLQYYFHGNALVNLFNERASTAMEEPNLLQDSKKEEVKDSHQGELTTTDGMNMVSRWTRLDEYASLILIYIKYHVTIVWLMVTLLFNAIMLLKNS